VPKPPDPAIQILSDVRKVLDAWKYDRIPSSVLAGQRNELEDRDFEDSLTANQLGRRLAGFGVHADKSPFRMNGKYSPNVRGYTIRNARGYRPSGSTPLSATGSPPHRVWPGARRSTRITCIPCLYPLPVSPACIPVGRGSLGQWL
jgi:hypothetical protein